MPTDTPMQLGMVGLGRMGAGIVRRLTRDGHHCVGFDVNADAVKALEGDGIPGTTSLEEFAGKLDKPRTVWVMVPAGEITSRSIASLSQVLEAGRRHHRRRQHALPRRHPPREGARREGHPPRRRRHQRWRLRTRARLLPDDRRRGRRSRAPVSAVCLDCPRGRYVPADARAHRRPRPGGERIPPLRTERRRPLREDGPQRDRVRDHGRVRRGAQHPPQRERRKRGARGRRGDRADGASRVLPVRHQHSRRDRGVAPRERDQLVAARPDRAGAATSPRRSRTSRAVCRTPARGAGRRPRRSTRACRRRC